MRAFRHFFTLAFLCSIPLCANADNPGANQNVINPTCNISISGSCNLGATGGIFGITNYNAVRSEAGTNALGAIDEWGVCRYVNNTAPAGSEHSLHVPFRSSTEWNSFIANAPNTNPVQLIHCSGPDTTLTASPSPTCPNPTAMSPQTVSEPAYQKCNANGSGGCINPATWTSPQQSYTCRPAGVNDRQWVETVTAVFTGHDRDSGINWGAPITPTYSTTSAACGSSNGQQFVSAPTSNFCNVGVFSGVSGSGPWTWSCDTYQGLNNHAACSAGKAAPVCTPNASVDVGACSASCGGGIQTITVYDSCGNPTVSNQSCNTQSCACVPDGSTSQSVGGCSASCGGGIQSVTTYDSCGSVVGNGVQACNTQACACVPNGSTTQSVGSCSADCGGGTQSVTTYDSCGTPIGGGSQSCNTQACVACDPNNEYSPCFVDPCGAWGFANNSVYNAVTGDLIKLSCCGVGQGPNAGVGGPTCF